MDLTRKSGADALLRSASSAAAASASASPSPSSSSSSSAAAFPADGFPAESNAATLLAAVSNSSASPSPSSPASAGIQFQWLVPVEGLQSKLRWAFSFHVYFFGCTFFVLAVYTFSSVLNIRSQISRKRFMSGINTFLCIFGLSRAVSLCVDPYGSIKILPVPIANAVWAIGFPSLASSFCLLQLAFLHLTKLKFGAKFLRIEILLRSVITLHIFSSVLRAVVSSLHWSANVLVLNYVCESAFLCWALFLHASFLHIGYKSFRLLDRVPATMLQPDGCQNKGIMQLVMLAPASNLVTSVTAALMPTLLGPAASMTAHKTSVSDSAAANATVAKEKAERTTKAATGGAAILSGRLECKAKRPDGGSPSAAPPNDAAAAAALVVGERTASGPAKMKKLTWRSSISDANHAQTIAAATPSLPSETRASSNAAAAAAATRVNTSRPILKDASKSNSAVKCGEPHCRVVGPGHSHGHGPQPGPATGIENKRQARRAPAAAAAAAVGPNATTAADPADEKAAKENDLLLQTILNHIAYVNRASASSESGFAHCSHDATPTSRKKQVRCVLRITYAAAVLGFSLTVAEFFQQLGPYGLLRYYFADDRVQPWLWFLFQTFCRLCEILMGSAIANITKQSAASIHRYYKHNPVILKQRGSMFT